MADEITLELRVYEPRPLDAGYGKGNVHDLSDRIELQDLGVINRAVERDFLSFRTGDLTLTIQNGDGLLDDVFALMQPTDRWHLVLNRNSRRVFAGVVLPQGSIRFNRLEKSCEITAYGASRILEDTDADATVRRTFSDMTLTGTHTAGTTTLTLNTTSNLLDGDTLHITDHVNKDDVVVKQVTSSTQVTIEAGLGHTYSGGTPVTCTTPFYRYRTIDFLVRELYRVAGIPISDLRITNSQFKRLGPTPVTNAGLNIAQWQWGSAAERNGRTYITLVSGVGAGSGTYYQQTPDAAWVLEDATVRSWLDWSPYFREGDSPAYTLRNPTVEISSNGDDPHITGHDYQSGTSQYFFVNVAVASFVRKRTTTDGITWAAAADVFQSGQNSDTAKADGFWVTFDPVRRQIWYIYYDKANGTWSAFGGTGVKNDTGTALATMGQDDDGFAGAFDSHTYLGLRYIRDLDMVLAIRMPFTPGPASPVYVSTGLEICGFRYEPGSGPVAQRLFKKPFPNCLLKSEGASQGPIIPTESIRSINGVLYGLLVQDGAVKLFWSDDLFDTIHLAELVDATSNTRLFGARINGQYRIFSYSGTTPRNYLVAAPFYAGVIKYADFNGKTVADALNELAVLTNAVYWVDDDLQGHFVSRDLLPTPPDIPVIDLEITEQNDLVLWEDAKQFVKVTGGGFEATSGNGASRGDSQDISSQFVPNAAYAQALADSYHDFYSPQRRYVEGKAVLQDRDYLPLDRLQIDVTRYMIYQSDTDLGAKEVELTLIEDR